MKVTFILGLTLLSVSFLLTTLGLKAQETISLYLEPNTSGYLVDTMPSDDPRLDSAVQMTYDSSQPMIWKWFELERNFEGYVGKTYVTKGLTIKEGTPVYFVPGNEKAFLAILEEGNNAQVIGLENDWAKISVQASIPVYFESDAPVVSEEPVATSDNSDDFIDQSSIAKDSVPQAQEPVALTSSRNLSGNLLDRKIEGRLRPYRPYTPLIKPKYEWEIVDKRNKRIAFVDPKNLILDRPLETYNGLLVNLTGSLKKINEGRDILIVAKQIVPQQP